MFGIKYALKVAKEYYDDKTYHHAMRVAGYIAQNNMIPKDKVNNCIILAIMHDLLEDTKYEFPIDSATDDEEWHVNECLKLLTRDKKNSTYESYLQKIKESFDKYPEAYWVKLADMKDHLAQTETLTEKLRDKYLASLPYLL